MIAWKQVLPLLALSAALAACSDAGPSQTSELTLADIQTLLPGDYEGTGSRGQVYHTISKLDVPQFGGKVFYHHISTVSMRGPAAQRKVYKFDETGQKMKSTVVLEVGAPFSDAQSMERNLSGLPEKSLLRFPDSCGFQWSASGDRLIARVYRERCSYQSPAFGGAVSPEMTYDLSACGLNIREGIYREDGSPVFPPSAIDASRAEPASGDC